MIIVPKFGEQNKDISKGLLNTIEGKIEIQMQTRNYKESLSNCIQVIDNIRSKVILDEVVLHLPFSLHTFESIVFSTNNFTNFIEFIELLKIYSNRINIDVGILLHQENSLELLNSVEYSYNRISDILDYLTYSRIYLLVENCLPYMNDNDIKRIQSFDLLSKVRHRKLKACVDLCHLRCYENIFEEKVIIPIDILNRVGWIHFSDTTNNDGYKDKRTHGVNHSDMDRLIYSLNSLTSMGIDVHEVPLVVEVAEEDYDLRLNMLSEISKLNLVRNNLIFLDEVGYFK